MKIVNGYYLIVVDNHYMIDILYESYLHIGRHYLCVCEKRQISIIKIICINQELLKYCKKKMTELLEKY